MSSLYHGAKHKLQVAAYLTDVWTGELSVKITVTKRVNKFANKE